VVDDAHIHALTLILTAKNVAPSRPRRDPATAGEVGGHNRTVTEPAAGRRRRNRMLADTDAIRLFGAASYAQAADLTATAAALSSLPDSATAAVFGPVGAAFLAALDGAARQAASEVATLAHNVAAAGGTAATSASAYSTADHGAGGLVVRV
jgi:hypothetical protein